MLPVVVFAVAFVALLIAPVAYVALYSVAVALGFVLAWAGSRGQAGELLKRWSVPLALGLVLVLLKSRGTDAFKYDLLLVIGMPLAMSVAGIVIEGRPAAFTLVVGLLVLVAGYLDARAHGLLGRTWVPIAVSRGPIVCLGDSLTAGVGASPQESYPRLLEELLGLPVINAGVAGDTSADALRRLESDVLAQRPEAVILLIGGNDFLRHVPTEQFERNLDQILARLRGAGLPVLLIQQPTGPLSGRFYRVYADLARRHGALLFPETVVKRFYLHPNDYLADSIHWNARAHRDFARALLEYIERSP